jgi:cytochrome c-type biogenesis protein CcmI
LADGNCYHVDLTGKSVAFWIAALVLASAAAAWVALGVGRGLRNNNRAISADEDAARARLSALERDLAQDLISAEAAKAARLEIGRALARAKAGQNAPLSHGKTPAFLAIAGAGVAGLGPLGFIFAWRAGKPDAPYALRLERIRAQIDADITANPDNPGNLSAIARGFDIVSGAPSGQLPARPDAALSARPDPN